jgi:hypothetical protein
MPSVWDLILKTHLRVPGYVQGKLAEDYYLLLVLGSWFLG